MASPLCVTDGHNLWLLTLIYNKLQEFGMRTYDLAPVSSWFDNCFPLCLMLSSLWDEINIHDSAFNLFQNSQVAWRSVLLINHLCSVQPVYAFVCGQVKCPHASEALGKYNQDLCIKYGVLLGGGITWSTRAGTQGHLKRLCGTISTSSTLMFEAVALSSTCLIGGLEHFLFFHILGMSSSKLTFIFFRGVGQPPTSCRWTWH